MTLLCNGTVITPSEVIENGGVLFEDGVIKDVGNTDEVRAKVFRVSEDKIQLKIIDAKKKIILPGFINTHHHLYSTFARGMYIPGTPAKNFVEVLEKLWWKLDRVLTAEDIYYSSLIPLIECVKNGTTTIIDHHESQEFQVGSLDEIQKAVEKIGIRACLCFGTSDRYGKGGEGLKENERFLSSLVSRPPSLVTGMVGLHAPFTVNNDTLESHAALAKKYNVGMHIHCAEDLADENDSVEKYKMRIVERLKKFGALGEKTMLIHCIHIDEKEMEIMNETKTNAVHNPESNMNNAVGCADVLTMMKKGITVGLGTDGMSSDMLSQMRCAYLIHRHNKKDPRVAFCEAPEMLLQNNSKIAEKIFGKKTGAPVGKIEVGSPADLIVLDYIPPTPLSKDNFLGHLIFGIVDATVDTTICNGKTLMKDKKLENINEEFICQKSRELSAKFWERIKKL
ncbi:MAG: putative aminohydrolase SsnA [Elusimicrobia bacterium]|nr:putative aminohydrolase SsnA [Elusimicrobiota bacterium]